MIDYLFEIYDSLIEWLSENERIIKDIIYAVIGALWLILIAYFTTLK